MFSAYGGLDTMLQETCPQIEISYRTVMLPFDPLHESTAIRMCVLNCSSAQGLGVELIHPHLFLHPHGDHNTVSHALQDIWPGFDHRLWPQNRAKLNDNTYDRSLWPWPLSSACKPVQLNASFLSALCMSNVLQKKVLTISSQAAAMERILYFLHSPLLEEGSQITHSLMDC